MVARPRPRLGNSSERMVVSKACFDRQSERLTVRARELHGSKLCLSVVSWAEKGRGAVGGARRSAAECSSPAIASARVLRFVREAVAAHSAQSSSVALRGWVVAGAGARAWAGLSRVLGMGPRWIGVGAKLVGGEWRGEG